MNAIYNDLIKSLIQLAALVVFAVYGGLKLLNLLGYAPASYAKSAGDAAPAWLQSPLVVLTHVPAAAFFPLWGVVELAGAAAQFWRPKVTAGVLAAIVVIVEASARASPALAAVVCSNSAIPRSVWHLIALACLAYIYQYGEPLAVLLKRTVAHFRPAAPAKAAKAAVKAPAKAAPKAAATRAKSRAKSPVTRKRTAAKKN